MIKNDKEYQVTKSRLNDFEESLLATEKEKTDPLLKELYVDSIKSEIVELQKQIIEYENSKH